VAVADKNVVLVAADQTHDAIPKVGVLGGSLRPRGLMPSGEYAIRTLAGNRPGLGCATGSLMACQISRHPMILRIAQIRGLAVTYVTRPSSPPRALVPRGRNATRYFFSSRHDLTLFPWCVLGVAIANPFADASTFREFPKRQNEMVSMKSKLIVAAGIHTRHIL
jgi:hypothetical protein